MKENLIGNSISRKINEKTVLGVVSLSVTVIIFFFKFLWFSKLSQPKQVIFF